MNKFKITRRQEIADEMVKEDRLFIASSSESYPNLLPEIIGHIYTRDLGDLIKALQEKQKEIIK
jgi:hypothetical protein